MSAQKWEYTFQSFPREKISAKELEAFGNAGWEMCGATATYSHVMNYHTYTYYFKRPVVKPEEIEPG